MYCTYIDLASTFTVPKALYNGLSFTHSPIYSHTHTHQWMAAAMQGAVSPIGSNLGLSVLPKDTSTDWD